MCGIDQHKHLKTYFISEDVQIKAYDYKTMTKQDYVEAVTITIAKGYILFCTESGLVVKLTARTLGDGIKRLVSFFKDLKKEMAKSQGGRDDPLESYVVENLLKKYEIDLEML